MMIAGQFTVRPLLVKFAEAMELKLQQNEHKNRVGKNEIGQECSISYLVEGLLGEVAELIEAAYDDRFTHAEVAYEAADVGNYAVMIANRSFVTKGKT